MSFALSKSVDAKKVFLTRKSEVTQRWDPHFHQPRFFPLVEKLNKLKAQPLRSVAKKIFSGITPLSGGDAYTESSDGVPFVRSGDFNEDGTINKSDLIYLKPEIHLGQMERSKLAKNDVLFAIVGATIGKVGMFPDSYEANINQAVCAVRLDNQIHPQFVHSFFLTGLGQEQIERVKRPVARANINLEEIGSLRVPLVSDDIQNAVVKKLQTGFEQKQKLEKQAAAKLASVDGILLDELGITPKPTPPNTVKSRIFRRAFSAVTGNRLDPLFHHGDMFHFVRAAKCKLAPLGNYVAYFTTGFAAGRDDQSDEEGGIIQIRPTNLSSDRELVFNRNVYIARTELKQRPFDILQSREVLFNNTNSQEQVGKTTFFDLDGEFFCSNHITRIATDDSQLDPQFLGYVLNLYQRQQVFFKLATNWNNQSGVGVDVLEKIPVPLPDPKRQEEIVARLEKVRMDAHALRRQAAAELEAAKKEIEAIILGKEGKT